MHFINEFFAAHGDEFTDSLTGVGFTNDQIRQFIPEAASGILATINSVETSSNVADFLSDEPAQFLSSINVSAIARKLGMDTAQIRSGLQVLAPAMSQAISKKAYGLIGSTESLAWESRVDFISATNEFFFKQCKP